MSYARIMAAAVVWAVAMCTLSAVLRHSECDSRGAHRPLPRTSRNNRYTHVTNGDMNTSVAVSSWNETTRNSQESGRCDTTHAAGLDPETARGADRWGCRDFLHAGGWTPSDPG
ncbi:hypothetical protein KEM60_02071 [Austwickia sp. TVS 96-490-7B]|nr:hypothetical protein [Austwickia sp. TVS 96-490-7B]